MEPAYKVVTDKINAFNQNGVSDRHRLLVTQSIQPCGLRTPDCTEQFHHWRRTFFVMLWGCRLKNWLVRLSRTKAIGVREADIGGQPDADDPFKGCGFAGECEDLRGLPRIPAAEEQVHCKTHSAVRERPIKGEAKFLHCHVSSSVSAQSPSETSCREPKR